jgi:hypothetical protein
MSDLVTITLPRDVMTIVLDVLQFDLNNVDFDDPTHEYDTALAIATQNIANTLKKETTE